MDFFESRWFALVAALHELLSLVKR